MAIETEFITECWGFYRQRKHRYWIVYCQEMQAVTGKPHRSRRRAKKEITHYISKGLARGPFHGAYKYMKENQEIFEGYL